MLIFICYLYLSSIRGSSTKSYKFLTFAGVVGTWTRKILLCFDEALDVVIRFRFAKFGSRTVISVAESKVVCLVGCW